MLALLFSLAALLGSEPSASTPGALQHFQNCPHRTGGLATILVPVNPAISVPDARLEVGDEIAALTPSGECAGAAVWTGEGMALTLWEDDPFTPVLDGLRAGDPIAFEVYDASEGTVRAGAAVTIEEAYGATDAYAADALFVVGTRSTTRSEGAGEGHTVLGENFPNPFRGTTTVPMDLAEAQRVTFDVYDALGRHVGRPVDGEFGAGHHRVEIDAADLAPGLYVYRVTSGDVVLQRSFTVAR